MSTTEPDVIELTKPVLLEFAKAVYICQCFESSLCFLLALMAHEKIPEEGAFSASQIKVGQPNLTPLCLSKPSRAAVNRVEGQPLHVACDGKTEYLDALGRHPGRGRIQLEVHPNPVRGPKGSPRSAAALLRDRALHTVDQWHALVRHTRADHKRETISFGRRLNAIMKRLFLATVWRNFVKGRSERRPDPATPAMRLDLTREPWSWRRVLSRRLFPQRTRVPRVWREIYGRDWTTPVLETNLRHRLDKKPASIRHSCRDTQCASPVML